MTAASNNAALPWYLRPITLFCVWFYSLAALAGVSSVIVPSSSATVLLADIALALCLSLWAVADARERRQPIPHSQQMWFLMLSGLVVPGYLLLTRGWKGIVWLALHAVGWLVVAGGCAAAAAVAVQLAQ